MNLILLITFIVLLALLKYNKSRYFRTGYEDDLETTSYMISLVYQFKDVISPYTHVKIRSDELLFIRKLYDIKYDQVIFFDNQQIYKILNLTETGEAMRSISGGIEDRPLSTSSISSEIPSGAYMAGGTFLRNGDWDLIFTMLGNLIIVNTKLTIIKHTNTEDKGVPPYYFGTSCDGTANIVDGTDKVIWSASMQNNPYSSNAYSTKLESGGTLIIYNVYTGDRVYSSNSTPGFVPFSGDLIKFILVSMCENLGNPSTSLKITPTDIKFLLSTGANPFNMTRFGLQNFFKTANGPAKRILLPGGGISIPQGSCISANLMSGSRSLVNGIFKLTLEPTGELILYKGNTPGRKTMKPARVFPPYYFGVNYDSTLTITNSLGNVVWANTGETIVGSSIAPFTLTLGMNGLLNVTGTNSSISTFNQIKSENFAPISEFYAPLDPISGYSLFPGASEYGPKYTVYTSPNLIKGVTDTSGNPFVYNWVCPPGVFSVCVLCVGGGGGGGAPIPLDRSSYECHGSRGRRSIFGDNVVVAEGGNKGIGGGIRVYNADNNNAMYETSVGEYIHYGHKGGERLFDLNGDPFMLYGGGGAGGYIKKYGDMVSKYIPEPGIATETMGGGHVGRKHRVIEVNGTKVKVPSTGGGGIGLNGSPHSNVYYFKGDNKYYDYTEDDSHAAIVYWFDPDEQADSTAYSLGGAGGGLPGGDQYTYDGGRSAGAPGGAFGGGGGGGAWYSGNDALISSFGGGGGVLAYTNNIPVIPGKSYKVFVGDGGEGGVGREQLGGKGGPGAVKIIWGMYDSVNKNSFPYLVPKSNNKQYGPLEFVSFGKRLTGLPPKGFVEMYHIDNKLAGIKTLEEDKDNAVVKWFKSRSAYKSLYFLNMTPNNNQIIIYTGMQIRQITERFGDFLGGMMGLAQLKPNVANKILKGLGKKAKGKYAAIILGLSLIEAVLKDDDDSGPPDWHEW